MSLGTSFGEILLIVVILCPVPYVYLYCFMNYDDQQNNDFFDVYYARNGRDQASSAKYDDCNQCFNKINAETKLINAGCVGVDYKCGLKLALQSFIKSFDHMNKNMDDLNAERIEQTTYFAMTPTDGNLFGMTSDISNEYDYLTGEWNLSSMLHNGFNVWTKYDKYRRHLKLFLYDNDESKRWIVGHNLSSDAAYIYSPQHPVNPVYIIFDGWLYHNNSIKAWRQLKKFRFSPSENEKTQIQSVSLQNNSLIRFDQNTKIKFVFTHFLEIGSGQLIIYQNGKEHVVINANDTNHISVCDDTLILTNLTLAHNASFYISLRSNFVHSMPKNEENGNVNYEKIIFFQTKRAFIDWQSIGMQFLSLLNGTKLNEERLTMSYLFSCLFLDDDSSNNFNFYIEQMSASLSIKKQQIINKNSSEMRDGELQLLKSSYYLRLSQVNALKAYHYLWLRDAQNSKKFIDKALKICIKQFYGSKKGKKFVDELILEKNAYHRFFCNFHSFDTWNYLKNGNETFDILHFINTVKLRWIMREFLTFFYDDLIVLFESKQRILNYRIEFVAHFAPRYEVLFGLRNLNFVKSDFANYGVVQMKNFLNFIECEWLKNYYLSLDKVTKTNRNDRISYFYLQHFNEIISFLVGRNVKKSYSEFIDFNDAKFYKKGIAQKLSEESAYTLMLTINVDENFNYFPLYFIKRQFPSPNGVFFEVRDSFKPKSYEIISNVGDAILFKGSGTVHWAPYANSIEAENYWVIVFHFVDILYEFKEEL